MSKERTAKEKLEEELFRERQKFWGSYDKTKSASELREKFPAMFERGELDSFYGKLIREEQLKKETTKNE